MQEKNVNVADQGLNKAHGVNVHTSLPVIVTDDAGNKTGIVDDNSYSLTYPGSTAQALTKTGSINDIDLSSLQMVIHERFQSSDAYPYLTAMVIPGLVDRSVANQVTFWVGAFRTGRYTEAVQVRLTNLPDGGVSINVLQAKTNEPSNANGTDGSYNFNTQGSVYTVLNSGTDASGLGLSSVTYNRLIDDSTPTLSGALGASLGQGEELAIYQTVNGVTTKVGVASLNGLNWSYTPSAALADGTYSFKVMVQPVGNSSGTAGRVIAASQTVTIDTSIPTQTVTISSVTDNVNTNGSVGTTASPASVATGGSTDDTTPTLSGTVSAALTGTQVLAVYDGATRMGTATVSGTSWTFTPANGLLAGQHNFTVQVENRTGTKGPASAAYGVNVHTSLPVIVTDDAGNKTGIVDDNSYSLTYPGSTAQALTKTGSINDIDLSSLQMVIHERFQSSDAYPYLTAMVIPGLVDRSVANQVTFWVGALQ